MSMMKDTLTHPVNTVELFVASKPCRNLLFIQNTRIYIISFHIALYQMCTEQYLSSTLKLCSAYQENAKLMHTHLHTHTLEIPTLAMYNVIVRTKTWVCNQQCLREALLVPLLTALSFNEPTSYRVCTQSVGLVSNVSRLEQFTFTSGLCTAAL